MTIAYEVTIFPHDTLNPQAGYNVRVLRDGNLFLQTSRNTASEGLVVAARYVAMPTTQDEVEKMLADKCAQAHALAAESDPADWTPAYFDFLLEELTHRNVSSEPFPMALGICTDNGCWKCLNDAIGRCCGADDTPRKGQLKRILELRSARDLCCA